jgi:hypothetical protein
VNRPSIRAWSSAYNIGADAHHTKPVFALMTMVRDRSLRTYSADIKVHDPNDRKLILKGAGQSPSNQGARQTFRPDPPGLLQSIKVGVNRREGELLPSSSLYVRHGHGNRSGKIDLLPVRGSKQQSMNVASSLESGNPHPGGRK